MKDMQVTCLSRFAAVAAGLLAASFLIAACSSTAASPASSGQTAATSTVWLCLPGMTSDPCRQNLATTAITATGARSVSSPQPATSTRFACFYMYGTVSEEPSVNADLRRGKAEIDSAMVQAAPFSPVCQVYAPIYRQVTLAGLEAHPDLNFGPAETVTAYDSIKAGFYGYHVWDLGLAQDNLVSDVAAAETTWTQDQRLFQISGTGIWIA
jgi:hypothetical protein